MVSSIVDLGAMSSLGQGPSFMDSMCVLEWFVNSVCVSINGSCMVCERLFMNILKVGHAIVNASEDTCFTKAFKLAPGWTHAHTQTHQYLVFA